MVEHDPYSTLPPTAADPSQASVPAGRPAMLGVVSSGEGRGPSPDDSVSGRRIVGNDVIERELGRGGIGLVYLATHAQLRDRRYAVKLFSAVATTDAVEQLRPEVEAIGKSRHANLRYAIDVGSHEGNPYLVTELLEGRDIAKIIRGSGVLAVGVQFEYWIGRWTLSARGFLIEVVGMLVTAGIMVIVIAYVASQYTAAIELTASGRGGLLDRRMEQRLEQFNLARFPRSSVFSRPGGMAVASLLVLTVSPAAGRSDDEPSPWGNPHDLPVASPPPWPSPPSSPWATPTPPMRGCSRVPADRTACRVHSGC